MTLKNIEFRELKLVKKNLVSIPPTIIVFVMPKSAISDSDIASTSK